MSTSAPKPSKIIGSKQENTNYTERAAVRVITQNSAKQIIIIHAAKENYYKLPGGGVELEDTDHAIAAQREAMEETGCEVTPEREYFASVEEWRNDLHQFSYCYRATLVKDTGNVELTEDEVEDGLKHEWVSVESALEKMKGAEPTSLLGRFIKERDIFFVQEFLKLA
ncbi:hypothetical protein BT63DRAFT_423842 [Microthyrium microscopicum]|uniref:Nudix hydrolase domain-containing protein n=1 Tax=Microthyrium microscopicum TaxID=703497 RepID=A0A6A6UCI2_9PEZI|nr:hypothetical protein BT63DRAFT_423842 [Microthyrium microscopicum]